MGPFLSNTSAKGNGYLLLRPHFQRDVHQFSFTDVVLAKKTTSAPVGFDTSPSLALRWIPRRCPLIPER
jgi:hypothetical protein